MQQWELLDSGRVPESNNVMALMRRGHELVIRVDDRELMGNRAHGSEDALSDLACDHLLPACPNARVLIGGWAWASPWPPPCGASPEAVVEVAEDGPRRHQVEPGHRGRGGRPAPGRSARPRLPGRRRRPHPDAPHALGRHPARRRQRPRWPSPARATTGSTAGRASRRPSTPCGRRGAGGLVGRR
ncbi:MAG: hypothetical protein R3F43_19380 [bacterium]